MPRPESDWWRLSIVWWLTGLGTGLVATGAAWDYGVSWFVSLGIGCWLLAGVYGWLTRRDR